MIRDKINNEYLDWMCNLVDLDHHGHHRRLAQFLYDYTFRFDIPFDDNRAEDGVDLRYRFGDQAGYSQTLIATTLDRWPCSVLEMMVALANRCEESIMTNPELGDRTGLWFWEMIVSLGLSNMDDTHFDEKRATEHVERFLNHKYEKNGHGGLFTVGHPDQDLRSVEIWIQMWQYLSEQ